jgi:peptide/nickel transport system substrate-binding protein
LVAVASGIKEEFDPALAFGGETIWMWNVYETLLYYDLPEAKEPLKPGLATSWEVSEDGKVWTFHLRKGVKFHSGNPFTAEDVKFSIERTMEIGLGPAYIWSGLDRIEVLDDYTVSIYCEFPMTIDLIAASLFGSYIVDSKYMMEHAGNDLGTSWLEEGHASGTGPYRLELYSAGVEYVLTKFDDYWKGWDGKHFDTVIIKIISEDATRFMALKGGDADIVWELSTELIDDVSEDPNLAVINIPCLNNMHMFFNTQKFPTNNKLLREAISYVFDYEKAVEIIAKGYATQARGPLPKNIWGYNEDLFQYKRDVDKAKELIKQSGLNTEEITITMSWNRGWARKGELCYLLMSNLDEIGIKSTIDSLPGITQYSMHTKSLDTAWNLIGVRWYPTYLDPYDFLFSLYDGSQIGGYNFGWYNNPEYDQLVAQAHELSASNREEATRLFKEAQEILVEDNVAIWIWDENLTAFMRKDVKGATFNPLYGGEVLSYYDLYRE